MHRKVTVRQRLERRRDERGAVAIMIAFTLTAICVVTAMVMDFGLVRLDRQVDRSAADSATLAGLHGLNKDDGIPHSYVGVCAAVRYLKANDPRFAGINEATGWKDGNNAATGNGCSSTALTLKSCKPADKSTWAKWHWAGSTGDLSMDVTIQSGFSFATAPALPEDSLAASSSDTTDTTKRYCDTLAVTIGQSRKPGLGSLATSSRLSTVVRSVGRVKTVPGSSAPAMLLLKRTGCPALRTGNSGSGSGTFIHVLGAITSTGLAQAGSIHADSDGTGCTGGSNSNIFIGAQDSGIVAYAAPLVSNPTAPDPTKPGLVTSYAAATGANQGVVRDQLDYVYGSTALTSGGTRNEVSARPLITRKLIDDRYFTGVKAAITAAAPIFSAPAAPAGFNKTLNNCTPTAAQVASITSADTLYVNCTANNGFQASGITINANAVYFNGTVNPSGTLKMPNATKVYIGNQGNKTNALAIGNGASFEMNNSAANMSGTLCSTAVNAGLTKGTLFIRTGSIAESNGGMLRLCRTTAFMLGGQSDGCVPATSGNAPTTTPCAGTLGTGQFTQTGGDIDWTAPNSLDQTLDTTTNTSLPAAVTAWADPNGPEDLALWSESATNTSQTYNMNGGGIFNVRGVFMVPNADPFKISGGAGMNLTNAQYIVTSIELNGGTQITMKVDPNSAVTLPDLDLVGLIR
jgi:Flp pilus assembly protein TadG